MSRLRSILWLPLCCWACQEPDSYRDCYVLDGPGYEPLEGSMRLSYEGQLNPYISQAESPRSPFRLAGRLVNDRTRWIAGCGVDAQGHLWMLETYWGVPRAEPPMPVFVDHDEWTDETATFSGWAMVCLNGDCSKSGPTVFDTTGFSSVISTPEGPFKVPSGSGEVTDYGEEPWSFTAYAIVNGSPGTREDTRVEVDVTWPINARPGESSCRDAGGESPMCAPEEAGVVNDAGGQDSIEQAPL